MVRHATGFSSANAPTVLLVHGAFGDASIWAGVIPELQAAGIDALAPANPLRGLRTDAAYVASVAREIAGPVLLVGHSYGGAVTTVAGSWTNNAVGLAYVGAYALDEGESAVDINGRFPPRRLGPALRPAAFSTSAEHQAVELYLKREAFRDAFAADLPARLTTVMAASQRPVTAAALEERAPSAAWETLPSWYLVTAADQAIHPEAQRFMARRAGALTVEVDASHAVALSRPGVVVDLIRGAVTHLVRRP